MIGALRRLISKSEEIEQISDDSDIRVACAALLSEAASMDMNFGEDEKRVIVDLLSRRFKISLEESKDLLELGKETAEKGNDLLSFTKKLKDAWNFEERSKFIEMLWKVAVADKVIDPYEDMLIRRVAGLIYVNDKERGEAKKRALQNF